MSTVINRFIVTSAVLATALTLAACGEDEPPATGSPAPAVSETAPAPTTDAPGPVAACVAALERDWDRDDATPDPSPKMPAECEALSPAQQQQALQLMVNRTAEKLGRPADVTPESR